MDGPNWADNTNWLTDAPLSEWYGAVSGGWNLNGNRLKGEIPAEFGELNWERLDLGNNLLSGCIPLTLVYHRELRSADFGLLKGCESPDRAALVNLYHATGGPDWTESKNWLSDSPIGDWHGVAVDERGRVVSLSLELNGLSGEIPAALGDLAELDSLNLRGTNRREAREGVKITNQLTGGIPPELGNLVNLTSLSLYGNQLTGAIPPELGNLGNLRSLSLGRNQLTGAIPPELGNLGNLEDLYLSENQLTGAIPPELGNLGNLEDLYLRQNQLTGAIPPELGNLGNLKQLFLDQNQLTGAIPPELGNLGNLEWLYLGNNQLTGAIPPELGDLGKLVVLYLNQNQLTGAIPPELGNLVKLQQLDLVSNQLTGAIPPELLYAGTQGYAEYLHLNLSGNQFSECVSQHLKQNPSINPEELGLAWCE